MTNNPVAAAAVPAIALRKGGAWRGIRVLAWDGGGLYGCRGYQVVRLNAGLNVRVQVGEGAEWEVVANFRPAWWRSLTSRTTLSSRLVRDGFHAMAILGGHPHEQTMVGAVPGALGTR